MPSNAKHLCNINVQCRTNVEDVVPTFYKCMLYKCLLDVHLVISDLIAIYSGRLNSVYTLMLFHVL